MNTLEIWLLALALAMDCFTVSTVSGIILKKMVWRITLSTAILFGFFQGVMPLIGWLGTTLFKTYIETFDHWLSFALLSFIGGKMIYSHFKGENKMCFNPSKIKTQIVLAIATSIDALAAGISFACTDMTNINQIIIPIIIIGFVSFIMSILGMYLGVRFGYKAEKIMKPDLLGGVILVAIGVKILVTHLGT